MRSSVTFLLAALLTVPMAFQAESLDAQVRTYRIQGQVMDAGTNQPMAGVQVQIRGTSQGALTNTDGRYVVAATLPQGDYTLSFTFIGRATATASVTLGTQTTVSVPTVSLEESAVALEELVVTATGVQSVRRSIGNTVETVTGEVVNEAIGAATLDQALQGKLLGAWISEHSGQPGGGASIRLRGTNSIFGGAEPLIVIDGVIVDNNNEALVSLSGNAGRGGQGLVNRLADLAPSDIERVEVLKGAAAAALYGSKANNGVIQVFTKSGQQGDTRMTFSTEFSLSQVPDEYEFNNHPRAGLGDVIWGGASGLLEEVERFDIQDEIWEDAWGNRNNVSVSGGDANTTFYVAGNWESDDGILRATDFERKGVRAKLTHQVTDRLEVGAMGNFLQTEFGFMPEGEQGQGTLTAAIFTPNSWDFRFDENLGRYPRNPILGANPLDVFDNWDVSEDVTRFAGNLNATFRATDDFTVRYLFGIDDYRQETHYFQPPQSISAGFTGSVQNPVRLSRQLNSDVTATLVSRLTDDLSLESTGGIRYTEDNADIIRAAVSDLPPGQSILTGANQFASQGVVEFRTFGGFLQEQFAYQDRLYVNVGLNVEGSSAFGEDQRWQLFPKANASWVVHESDFWRNSGIGDAIGTLRLRAAYGETGGQPPGAFDRFENFFGVAYSGKAGLVPSSRAGNPDLEPERQREFEVGADLGFLDDRAQLELTYYTRTTEDLVLPVQLPPSRGVQSQFQNVGEVENSGWELALSTVDWDVGGVTWRSRLQLSANDNVVKELVAADDTLTFGYFNVVTEGQPVGAFYGWYYERDENGEIVIDPDTGLGQRATAPDGTPLQKILGDPNPDLLASFSNTFDLGSAWELSVLFDGRFGNEVADFSRRIMEFFGSHANVEQEVERALEREDNPDLTPIQYTLNVDRLLNYEEFVEDGSFIKLREVGLSYRAPSTLVERFFGAESATVRLAGRNLVTWTDYGGLDPEVNLFSGNTVARGVDFATTPLPRQYTLSFQFVF